MSSEDWRVEINLDDEQHGYSLGERLRAHDLDEEARKRLGERVYVSRNGPELFVYTQTEEQAREAESVLRRLVAEDDLSAEFRGITRWHAAEEEWKGASGPPPSSEAEGAEDGRESADWLVKVNLPSADDARDLADSLRAGGYPVHRVWRWVTVDVPTEEAGQMLVSSVRAELPADAEIWVEGNPDARPAFVFLDPRMY